MIRHYEGELGKFDYDDNEFVIVNLCGETVLNYCGFDRSVNLPHGCISTKFMFYNCRLLPGFKLGDDFDTSHVKNMEYMFHGCSFPLGFSLGDKFDTSNVTSMNSMFRKCVLRYGFSLGEKFDTSKVRDMRWMFEGCYLPDNFYLGNKFNTDNLLDASEMFYACRFPKLIDIDKPAEEIIELLKHPAYFDMVSATQASGSEVWNILDKSKYTAEGIAEMEQIYAHLYSMRSTLGLESIKKFYDMWNYHASETYMILKRLAHAEDMDSMNLF